MPTSQGLFRTFAATTALFLITLTGPLAWAQQDSNTTTKLVGAYYWKATACFVFVYAYDNVVDSGIGEGGELPGFEEHTHYLVKEAIGGGECVLRRNGEYKDYETICKRKLPVLKRILGHIADGGSAHSNGGVRQLEPLSKLSACPFEVKDEDVTYTKGDYSAVLDVELDSGREGISHCYEVIGRHMVIVQDMAGGCCGSFWSGQTVIVADMTGQDADWQNDQGFGAYKDKEYPQAVEHFRIAVQLDPTHKNGNFNLACTLSILKKEFAEIQKPLEALLAQPKLKAKYCKKTTKDSDLKHYRDQPAYQAWHAKACGSK